MIAVGVGAFILLAVVLFLIFSLRSFTAMCNYVDLNDQSRNTSDVLSRDVRSAFSVTSASSAQLVLDNAITYTYDNKAGTLTRTQKGVSQTMLKEVNNLQFSLWQRPTNNAAFGVFPAASAATAKLVSLQWTCSRQVANYPSDSESIQMAMVALRNE